MNRLYHARLRSEELLYKLENGGPVFVYDENDEKRDITEQEQIKAIAEVREDIRTFKMEKTPLSKALIRNGARIVYKEEPLKKIIEGYSFCSKDEYESNINWERTKGCLEFLE